jgi:2-dehydro-3-deoxyphosphooctonate aldolase (KDO 8-P synthase)
MRSFELAPGIPIGTGAFPVIAGPCMTESEELTVTTARLVAAIGARLGLRPIFKASFDKANRSAAGAPRGPGRESGLPLLTDVHEPAQCEPAAAVCAVLQIPAFLCRQTDLVVAAARTGRAVNVKKGQFMAPDDMLRVVEKAAAAGNERVFVTERGFSFGYHNLVVDMRSFAILHRSGIPVVFDVTHSLQLPGAAADGSGGEREFAEPLARAAVAAGADGLFLEVHPNPAAALSDRATQLPPERAEALLRSCLAVRGALAEAGG